MRIELKRPHKSIETFPTMDLPGFAVLIGRKGAGKTQLLDALRQGAAEVAGISIHDVEMYDMATFHPPDTGGANRHGNNFAKSTADVYLLSQPGGPSPAETASAIFDQFAGDIARTSGPGAREDFVHSLRTEVEDLADFAIFGSGDEGDGYMATLYRDVLAPLVGPGSGRRGRSSPSPSDTGFNGNKAALLSAAMKQGGKLPHELARDDILRAGHFEGETLSNTLSDVFAAYKVDQFVWAHKRVETEHIPYADLVNQYRTKYPPPWRVLREILSTMRHAAGTESLFDFDFSDPEDYELDMGTYEAFGFRSEMTNRTTGARYDLNSLSSGEKILMALCLVSFNQYLGRRRPKLLLLDELDAVLHPSMVTALVSTLKELFVERGTRVLMTSHSPMTVAALDDSEIFRVARTGSRVEVVPATRAEAISELSEGIATVDMGLRIAAFDEARVTIITEGHNAKHLKRWAQLTFPEEVRVFEGLEQHTSDGQLLAYGRLLGKMKPNTHFVVVWDCDAADKAEDLRRELPDGAPVTPFAFARRQENTIAQKGIENAYDEKILQPFSITKSDSDGAFLGRELPRNRKAEFADHVLREGTVEYFTHFQNLDAVVGRILAQPDP